jgi:outer membrane scaffolding protein for murein synthesis (MipA/OmpV family)
MDKLSNNSIIKFMALAIFIPILSFSSKAAKADIFDDAISTLSDGFDYIWPDGVGYKDFNYRLGFGTGAMPDYKGSDDYGLRVIPLIDVRYKNIWTLQGTKLRVNLLSNEVLKIGPTINYRFGRSEKDSLALSGLGDTPNALQFGGFAEFQMGLIMASAEFKHAISSEQGSEAIFILGNGIYRDEKWLVVMGFRGIWSDQTHTQTNYGVDEIQALASVYDVTNMTSGFSDIGINFIARYQINDKARVESIIGYSRILGSAANSPIVKLEGSANQVLAGVGLRYSF